MSENQKKPRKFYQSKVDYSKKYNAGLSSFQISKELHQQLKEFLKDKNLTIRQWIEEVIKKEINER